jgi:hypothetical protein
MSHEIAKLLLEHADTLIDRVKAIDTAMSLGMPLYEIEIYLDWLDATRPPLESGETPETVGGLLTNRPADERENELGKPGKEG